MKIIGIVNIVLIILIITLTINLIFPINKIPGNLDELLFSPPIDDLKCYFSNSGELNKIQINRCCYDIQRQIACKQIDSEELNIKCFISETSESYYLINHETVNYCKKEGYDVKVG